MESAAELGALEEARESKSKPSSERLSQVDVEAVHDSEKYAVYGNIPFTDERSKGLLGHWERLTNWLLLEWSVESRG